MYIFDKENWDKTKVSWFCDRFLLAKNGDMTFESEKLIFEAEGYKCEVLYADINEVYYRKYLTATHLCIETKNDIYYFLIPNPKFYHDFINEKISDRTNQVKTKNRIIKNLFRSFINFNIFIPFFCLFFWQKITAGYLMINYLFFFCLPFLITYQFFVSIRLIYFGRTYDYIPVRKLILFLWLCPFLGQLSVLNYYLNFNNKWKEFKGLTNQ